MLSVFPKVFTLTFSANFPLRTLTYVKCVALSGEATQLDSQTVTEKGDKLEKNMKKVVYF